MATSACGGGGEKTAAIPSEDAPAATATTTETESTPAPAPPSAAVKALAAKVPENGKKRPRIPRPEGDPPKKLMIVDITKGSGPAVKSGDQVTVDYAGTSWSTGQEFDASWKSGQQFPFELGAGNVIQGWDLGVPGMKKGGRRLLVIPPEQGYGAQGSPPNIGPNETLVFVVDLRKIG